MKKLLVLLLIILIPVSFVFSKDNYFKNKKFAVLIIDELPAQAKKGLAGANTLPIKIKNGEWKVKQILGGISGRIEGTSSFKKNQILEIKSLKLKKNKIKISLVSLKPMVYGVDKSKFAKHANNITFIFNKNTTLQNRKKEFCCFLELFKTKKEAETFINIKNQVEIKIGMTLKEVKSILGEPLKVANIGNKILYKYKDWKITFIDGKVKDIGF